MFYIFLLSWLGINLAVVDHSHLFVYLVIFLIKLIDTIYCQSDPYYENWFD